MSQSYPQLDEDAPVGDAPRYPVPAVVQGAESASRHNVRTHASAAFIAQLIATAQKLPQTRERRRASPDDAVRCYTAMRDKKTRAGALQGVI